MASATQFEFQAAAVATGNGLAMNVDSLEDVVVEIAGITTATVDPEGQIIGGAWTALNASPVDGTADALQFTSDAIFRVNVRGLSRLRMRISVWTSGTINVDGFGQ